MGYEYHEPEYYNQGYLEYDEPYDSTYDEQAFY